MEVRSVAWGSCRRGRGVGGVPGLRNTQARSSGWSEVVRLIDREHQVCIKRTIFILIPNGKLQPICQRGQAAPESLNAVQLFIDPNYTSRIQNSLSIKRTQSEPSAISIFKTIFKYLSQFKESVPTLRILKFREERKKGQRVTGLGGAAGQQLASKAPSQARLNKRFSVFLSYLTRRFNSLSLQHSLHVSVGLHIQILNVLTALTLTFVNSTRVDWRVSAFFPPLRHLRGEEGCRGGRVPLLHNKASQRSGLRYGRVRCFQVSEHNTNTFIVIELMVAHLNGVTSHLNLEQ